MHNQRRTLSRSIIPSLVSVTIHAGIFAALVGITIDRFTTPPPRAARLSLESAAPPNIPSNPIPTDPQPSETPPRPAPSAETAPTPQPIPQTTQQATQQAIQQAARQLATPAAPPPPTPPTRAAPTIPTYNEAPAATFAGMRAEAAERIIFAVDASGAMVSTFSFIQEELARAIDKLSPAQSFQIIFFGERTNEAGEPIPYQIIAHSGKPDALIRATEQNRVLAMRWINNALPGGKSNPVEGLTAALRFEPDLVFLLARGIQRTGAAQSPTDLAQTLGQLDLQNPIDPRTGLRPTVIKAVEFIERDPNGLIEQIARAHGDGQTERDSQNASRLVTPQSIADEQRNAQSQTPQQAESPDNTQSIQTATQRLATIDRPALALLATVASTAEADTVRAAASKALADLAPFPPATRRTADPRPSLLRAQAALLLAQAETHPPKRTDLATQALADTQPLRIAHPATAAIRDTIAARAQILLSPNPSTPNQSGPAQTAHDQLLALLRTADINDPTLAPTLARAQLALLDAALAIGPTSTEADRARNSVQSLLPTIQDPAERAIFAAALARARLLAGRPIAEAIAPLTDLYDDRAFPEDARRAAAAPRITELTRAHDLAPDQLPLPALRALADHAGWSAASPDEHARAADLLVRFAEAIPRTDEHAIALRDAAHHARAAGQRARSRDLYARLAAEHPSHPDAQAALTLALDTPSPAPDDYRRALAINPAHPQADQWRTRLAALERGTSALDLLDAVTQPTRDTAALALELIDELLPRAADQQERTQLLDRAATQADRLGQQLDPARRLLLARSLAASDPAAARRTLDALPPDLAGSPDADRVRLNAAITAQIQSGNDARAAALAFATARDIAARRTPADGNLYWHALTLWLELGAQNGGPDAKAAARAHIAGLRQSHPDLGGDPWRARLNALAR